MPTVAEHLVKMPSPLRKVCCSIVASVAILSLWPFQVLWMVFPRSLILSSGVDLQLPPVLPAMAKQVEGKLCVARANGQQFDVKFDGSDTTLTLKARLYDQMVEGGQSEAVQCSGMKLLHGLDILHDDWVLKDHGIEDGAHLTLVISSFPSGTYNFVSRRDNAPAGSNTTARVQVSFHQDGAFSLSIHESEITSLVRFTDSDPYQMGERYAHEYSGKATAGEEKQIVLKVLDYQRKGIRFQSDPHADLIGEMQESMDEIRLQLPFEAGACNEGKAGLKWISLLKSFKEVKTSDDADLPGAPHPDPFAPPEEPDPAAPGGRDTFLAALHRRRFEAVRKAHPGSAPSAKLIRAELCFSIQDKSFSGNDEDYLSAVDCFDPSLVSNRLQAEFWVGSAGSYGNASRLCSSSSPPGKTLCFDPLTHRWESLPPMQTPRYYAAMVAFNHRIYVCGGKDDNDSEELSSVEGFDPETGCWEVLPSMNSKRANAGIVASGGYVYICGGKRCCNKRNPHRSCCVPTRRTQPKHPETKLACTKTITATLLSKVLVPVLAHHLCNLLLPAMCTFKGIFVPVCKVQFYGLPFLLACCLECL
ncbi:unnamed protein product [Durusdinium trenchii]|uniref:Ubiquitin-like domain-containing protein n=1 Tax=Durusdinium trenchii TaxID=1381693 RepID=A0ABP0P3M6_9DINO